MLCQYCHPFKFKSREELLEHLCYDYKETLDSKTEFDYFIERLSPNLNKFIKGEYKLKKLVIFLAFGMLRQNPSKRLTLKKIIRVLNPIVKDKTQKIIKIPGTQKHSRKIMKLLKKTRNKRKIYPFKLRSSESKKRNKSRNRKVNYKRKTPFQMYLNTRKNVAKKVKKSNIRGTDMIIYH